ncbi:hypothetical protein B0A58_10590 [Flavobacterium branchiophilum NBRC 15030 = ATCC 35035]|uniref:Type I restriction enzyme S subunit n=1 Tax=Flavobacterium branchiophilum TaxID=55197 RepID=A0A543G8B1_9FLAO|nr:restriction endonuclease subunit S [Flavobacterium branchiophilum]OXA74582.1 hypothetical protein B0A58_10590 [Flavobacterium branchiophilum NBRC 15030 = ATCC 35035]TQM42326.1 type I restriction enzyme S subunit [Flavobacterium branchiophilum]GEM55513.1 restriction modification system DNA specificity domain-containing protein [Flavobacterium branchiophilum NBRC 15030 = ATCC 35035]
MKKYNNYKNCGVEWLGEIPEHWELTRLGTRFLERKSKVSDKDFEPLSVTKNGVFPQLASAAKSNDGDNRKLVKKGDFVINSRSDRKASSGISDRDGSVSLIYIVIEPININSTYCNYLLRGYNFVEEFYRMGHGIVADLWTTRYDEMKSIMVGIPPISEQTAIAHFLDDKTTKIDQAIAIKQQQIDLLKERRQILIHKAVTRGLDDKVKLKNSGVEWIGEIPEGWEVKRFRNTFKLGKGLTITKENLTDEGIFCVNYGEIHSKFRFEVNPEIHKLKCVHPDYLKNNSSSLINKGDFVFADTSEDLQGSGNFTYLNSNKQVFAGYHTVIARPNEEIVSRFIAYEFESLVFRSQIQAKVKGVKVYSITQSILKELSVLVPPKNEQIEVVGHLDNSTTKIATAISLKEQEIDRLKEYKMSLIDGVVSGKVKVC